MRSLMEARKRQKVCYACEWIWVWTGSSYPGAFSLSKMKLLQYAALWFFSVCMQCRSGSN